MNIKELKERLEECLDKDIIKYDEPLKNHTSFKVGGPCSVFVSPRSKDEVIKVVTVCKETKVPFFIIGNGSNLIVKDGGFKGVIIQLTSMKNIELNGKKIVAQAGATLAMVASIALKNNLSGMEFASGIPGTVGGAVTMNAGAYGGEMRDIIESVSAITTNGEVINILRDDLELSYRSSVIQKNNYILLDAVFSLEDGNYDEIKEKMNDLNGRRKDKQPLNYPSAGSTFKRPPGNFAGKLIEDTGLKGYSFGGAKVSEKHAGFIINYDNATANDIISLIQRVQERVNEEYGVLLETEVKVIGED